MRFLIDAALVAHFNLRKFYNFFFVLLSLLFVIVVHCTAKMRLTDGCLICARHLDANQNSNNGDWRTINLKFIYGTVQMALSWHFHNFRSNRV